MHIAAYHHILSITAPTNRSYSCDAAGRLYSVYDNGWFYQRSLNGAMIARRWDQGYKQVRRCTSDENTFLCNEFIETAGHVLGKGLPMLEYKTDEHIEHTVISDWLERASNFNFSQDIQQFHQTYQSDVGILPPDHYLPVVIQLTEGCAWNKCSFCHFYKGQQYKKKNKEEIYEHIHTVKRFFGQGISLRNSIFLSEANAFVYDPSFIADTIQYARALLEPVMPDLRCISAFLEPGAALHSFSEEDFSLLSRAGLTHIYVGLETGNEVLRASVGKSGSVSDAVHMIQKAKQGGLTVGIIVMLGLGGHAFHAAHMRDTVQVLKRLDLNPSDMIFLSPILDYTSEREEYTENDSQNLLIMGQLEELRNNIPPGVRNILYEINGFIY